MEDKTRVYAALVAAGIILTPSSKLILVGKKGKKTLPTGHMDRQKDKDLKEALVREMKEELKDEKGNGLEIKVMGSLGTIVRNQAGQDPKLIEIFRCATEKEEVRFEEKGETRVWLVEIDDAIKISDIDNLAEEGVKRLIDYLEGHLYIRSENSGGSDEEGEDCQSNEAEAEDSHTFF